MMFDREVVIGSRRLVIRLNGNPMQSAGENHFFGYPLHPQLSSISATNIGSFINNIKGYFVFVGLERDRMVIANDITGGFRLYTCVVGGTTYFSNDHDYLIRLMGENGLLRRDDNEYRYWCRHGYTTGGATYIAGLNKVEPASLIEATASGINATCYFKDIANEPDAGKHTELCLRELDSVVREATAPDKEVVLFFSGGVDSTLLALLLRVSKRVFYPVFMKARPFYRDNYESYLRAEANASYLGLHLHEIEIDIESNDGTLAAIARAMPFDRHPARLHFGALDQIQKRYGSDIIILSGQGADNVLSFGPSGRTKGDFAARALIYHAYGVLAKAAAKAVGRALRGRFRAPVSEIEYLTAFFDPQQYYAVLDDADPASYRQYIEAAVMRLAASLKSKPALLMYLKTFTYLQGADNQVVYASARKAGIERINLPYTSPEFIYRTIRYKDQGREFLHPKYFVRQSIRALGANLPEPHRPRKRPAFVQLGELIKQSDRHFYHEARRLAAMDGRWMAATDDSRT